MNVGIIGFGNMGRAIAEGLERRKSQMRLLTFDTAPGRADAAARAGVQVCSTVAEICAESDLLVIAVKPQNTDQLLADLRGHIAKAGVLSIVAGRSISYLRIGLGTSRVVRCMPSLAATVGKALVGITIPSDTDQELRSIAMEVAASMGTTVEVPEELLAAVTGISGSGIAFVFAFIHAMALGGTRAGLSYDTAMSSAVKVLEGACALLEDSGENPIALLSRVASPAGTTIAGIKALEERGFTAAVMEAVERAAQRADDLEH